MENDNSTKTASNFIWRFLERWGAQGVTFVVGIVLARLLDPNVYGMISLVTVFTTLLNVFIDSGLGTALIQKKDADDLDFSSVFWFNLVICIVLYAGMFFAAPAIASFYSMPELVPVVRVLSLALVISGVKNIQQAYVSRHLMFKKFFFATLGGTIGAAVIGIAMAYYGLGVWALVAQYLFNALVDTIILWVTVKWRPHFWFSFQRFKALFSYGWKILLSSLIDSVYTELRALIIGKFYSSSDLAFYTKGAHFPGLLVRNINSSMNSVLLPVLAKKQDDLAAIKAATKKTIRVSSYIIWPMMVGLCVIGDKLILLLLTEKWLPCVFFLRIVCFSQALQPLQTTNLSVIKAMGKAGLHLKLEIIKKSIAIAIVVASAPFGVKVIAIGAMVYAVIATVINSFPNKRLINYSYREQLKDLLPFISMSALMGAIVYCVGLIPLPTLPVFIMQVAAGIGVYLLLSVVFKVDEFHYFLDYIKKILHRKKADA